MGTIIFLCAFLACISAVLFVTGIIMLKNDCSFWKKEMQETDKDILKKQIKFDFILLGICLTSFVIFLSGYLIPTRHYKNIIKPAIKAEYGNVYEYKYSTMLNEGSFLYNNGKYSIEIIKDIDNNKYIKITKADDNNDSDESLNLPLKNK
jgi:hypothetical protein